MAMMRESRLAWRGPTVCMRAGDEGREEFRGNLQAHLELKKKNKGVPPKSEVCFSTPTPQHTPFHCGNCGSSSNPLCSLPHIIRTSLPFKWACSSMQSFLYKWTWIPKGNHVSQLPIYLSGKRVTNKSKPTEVGGWGGVGLGGSVS